jgi:competence protein ComFC
MANIFSFGLNILADIFYPKYCFGCKRSGSYLCKFCCTQVPSLAQSFCVVCNQPNAGGHTHTACLTELAPEQFFAAFSYHTELLSEMIIYGKYFFIPEIFTVLGKLAAQRLLETNPQLRHLAADGFVLCPIPLHSQRKKWRGFNQAEVAAVAIGNILKLPTRNLLVRCKNTKTQKDLSASQRKSNMAGAFACPEALLGPLPENILLIDDVSTTGQTFLSACATLKAAGAKKVVCMSLAKD